MGLVYILISESGQQIHLGSLEQISLIPCYEDLPCSEICSNPKSWVLSPAGRSYREGQAAPTHRQARVPEGTAPRSLSSDLEPTSGEALPSSAARRSQSRPQSASRQLAAEQRTSARAPAAAEATADLMGFHQQEADRPAPGGPPPREQRPQNHGSDDLMGLHSSSNVTGQQRVKLLHRDLPRIIQKRPLLWCAA